MLLPWGRFANRFSDKKSEDDTPYEDVYLGSYFFFNNNNKEFYLIKILKRFSNSRCYFFILKMILNLKYKSKKKKDYGRTNPVTK